MANRPDIIIVMTDEERAVPPYESAEVLAWRQRSLTGRRWFDEHGISFTRHYTGSLACVPSRPTIFTGQYPDLHGVTQTDGIGKRFDDSRLRWLRAGEVPTLGNWFRAAGYDTHYDGKWHISHADLEDPATGAPLATNDNEGVVDSAAVRRYLDADHHTSAHRRVHTMVGDFFAQPAHTHAEAKPSLRHQIQRGDLLGRDDRIAFRDQRDAGA